MLSMLMRTQFALLVVFAATLSACTNPFNKQAQREAQVAQENQEDDAKCQSGGAKPGTPAYQKCRQSLAAQRADLELQEAHSRAFQQTLGAGTDAQKD